MEQNRPAELTVRELRVRKKVLVTPFLQPREGGKRALDKLSGQPWPVEADLRHIKTTLGMEALSCNTPAMCKKELMIEMLAWSPRRFLSDALRGTAALVTLIAKIRVRDRPHRVELKSESELTVEEAGFIGFGSLGIIPGEVFVEEEGGSELEDPVVGELIGVTGVDDVAEEGAGLAGGVALFADNEAVGLGSEEGGRVGRAKGAFLIRHQFETQAGCAQVSRGEGAVQAGIVQVGAAAAEEALVLVEVGIVGIIVAAGPIPLKGQIRLPGVIERVADAEKQHTGEDVEIGRVGWGTGGAPGSEAQSTFDVVVPGVRALGPIDAEARGDVAAIGRLVAVGVALMKAISEQLAPGAGQEAGKRVGLAKMQGVDDPVELLFVEFLIVVEDTIEVVRLHVERGHNEGVPLIFIRIFKAEVGTGVVFDHVSEGDPLDLAFRSDADGLTTDFDAAVEVAPEELGKGPLDVGLEKVGGVDVAARDSAAGISQVGAAVLDLHASGPILINRFEVKETAHKKALVATVLVGAELPVERLVTPAVFAIKLPVEGGSLCLQESGGAEQAGDHYRQSAVKSADGRSDFEHRYCCMTSYGCSAG